MFINVLQDDMGKFNFDQDKVINPETGELVSVVGLVINPGFI